MCYVNCMLYVGAYMSVPWVASVGTFLPKKKVWVLSFLIGKSHYLCVLRLLQSPEYIFHLPSWPHGLSTSFKYHRCCIHIIQIPLLLLEVWWVCKIGKDSHEPNPMARIGCVSYFKKRIGCVVTHIGSRAPGSHRRPNQPTKHAHPSLLRHLRECFS